MDRLEIPSFSRVRTVMRVFSAQLAEGGGAVHAHPLSLYWSQIHDRKTSLRFLGIILRILKLRFTLHTSFRPLLLKGGGSKIC
jgi:hypothetical protein